MQLRDYQISGVEGLREMMRANNRRVICHAPTGAGKTVIAAQMIRSALEKGKRCLFLAASRELIEQCSDKLQRCEVAHGVIMAGIAPEAWQKVQLASKDTLHARGVRSRKVEMPSADLVIVDECHLSVAKGWGQILDLYPKAFVVGLTATPARGDGRGLGERYQGIVTVSTYAELVATGSLVPTRVFAPYEPDLKGVKTSNGDYEKAELERRMNQRKLVGDIYEHWERLAKERQTVVFASGVAHSMSIAAEFAQHGVEVAHLDGDTDDDRRTEIIHGLQAGRIQVVTNCGVLTTGWDCPPVSCAVLARPTKSLVLYRQMSGRVQRPYEGKADCLVIDHSGAVYMHGFPDSDDIPWSLDGKEKLQDRIKAQQEGKVQKTISCPSCGSLRRMGPRCQYCGFESAPKGKEVEVEDGQLEEVTHKPKVVHDRKTKERRWKHYMGLCIGKGWACKRAAGMYKGEFGVYPTGFPDLPRSTQWQMPADQFYQEFVAPQKARA